MMKILLIGGGVASARYLESLIWTDAELAIAGFNYLGKSQKLSSLYGVLYYDFFDMKKEELNYFDMVIVCVPLEKKVQVVRWLVSTLEYRGRVILEKPFAIGREDICDLKQAVGDLNFCIVACQRDFALENYRITRADEYNIVWNSINSQLHDNIVHMMPHLLSWLMLELESLDVELHLQNNIIKGRIGNSNVSIAFIHTGENYVKVNEQIFSSPNYRKINADIVNRFMNYTKKDVEENMKRALAVAEIISSLVHEEVDQL